MLGLHLRRTREQLKRLGHHVPRLCDARPQAIQLTTLNLVLTKPEVNLSSHLDSFGDRIGRYFHHT
jgi:hypothetical protein